MRDNVNDSAMHVLFWDADSEWIIRYNQYAAQWPMRHHSASDDSDQVGNH